MTTLTTLISLLIYVGIALLSFMISCQGYHGPCARGGIGLLKALSYSVLQIDIPYDDF